MEERGADCGEGGEWRDRRRHGVVPATGPPDMDRRSFPELLVYVRAQSKEMVRTSVAQSESEAELNVQRREQIQVRRRPAHLEAPVTIVDSLGNIFSRSNAVASLHTSKV